MSFGFWQRWGVGLDDVSFANAWLALGLRDPGHGKLTVRDVDITSRGGDTVPWRFPSESTQISDTPEQWAATWGRAVTRMSEKPVRLRVQGAPPDELIQPWYRLLAEANPAPRAVSLCLKAPRAQLDIHWPLRLGCLSDEAESVLHDITTQWPSKDLARMVRLDRDCANCDFLLHLGTDKHLLQQLLAMPFAAKANVIVMRGGEGVEWGETEALLTSILGQTRASGFVLVPRALDAAQLARLINTVVREMSHANPMDLSVTRAAREGGSGDILAGFTREVVGFSVRQLAARFNARLSAMPPDTVLDMSSVGPSNKWLARGVAGGGRSGGRSKAEMSAPDADRSIAASSIRIAAKAMSFGHEGEGASTLAEVATAMTDSKPPEAAEKARAARFLQQKSFVQSGKRLRKAKKGFIAGAAALVRVRIAAPEEGWDTLPTSFPKEKLPKHLESWTLTVWLTEPNHLPTSIKRRIKLPRDGNSTECEFLFRPRAISRFEGRLTVLHRGRVIQTAVLRAGVVINGVPSKEGAPKLEETIAVRQRLGALGERRRYDLAFVANHDSYGRPLLTALSDKAAWVKDLSRMANIAGKINKTLSPLAKSVEDYTDGLDGERGVALLIQLAKHGCWLKKFLKEALNDPDNNPASANNEYVQIVSTRSDAVVPLEFVYDYAAPEKGATPCDNWRKALKDGECTNNCHHSDGKKVCPMGFWGLRKVIERHAVRPGLARDGNVLYLQSEPKRTSDTLYLGGVAVLGSSKNVPKREVAKLVKTISKHCGAEAKQAKDWAHWEDLVKTHHPSLLMALPHTDGISTNVTMEIGKDTKETIELRETHVFPPPVEGHQAPLVALIGCDTAGTADDFGNHVLIIRDLGAGIVIGTIATVFGEHAAKVAGRLVEGLLPQDDSRTVRLGELMREIRRGALCDGLLMALCLVAFGDADWIISKRRYPSE